MLSDKQLQEYRDTGCTIVERFFDESEVAAMLAELERFKAEGMIRNVATQGDGSTQSQRAQNLQIIPLNDKSDLFRALPFAQKVRETVEQLLGGPFVRYLDQIFLKPGRHGSGTNWHQDNAYFHVPDPTRGLGMWTALHDAHRENGTLELVPSSHEQQLEHRRDMGSDHHVTCEVDESRAVPVVVPAGGVAFFNWGVAHCTRGNQTSHERAGLAYHYLRSESIPDQPIATSQIVHVSGDASTGGEAEYGQRVSGTWGHEVERAASGSR